MQIKVVIASSRSSYSGEEVRYSHGGGGLVAPLDPAVLAEGDVGAPVDQGLVGVVVVGQQALLELALVVEDCLEGGGQREETRQVLTGGVLLELGGGERFPAKLRNPKS